MLNLCKILQALRFPGRKSTIHLPAGSQYEKPLPCAGRTRARAFYPTVPIPRGTTGAYNLRLFLLPYRCVMPEIGKYISYQIGGLVLDALSVRAILYAVMLPLAKLGFKTHQVA